MNLLADESIDRQIVERLRQEGHDVLSVAELSPSIADEEVLRLANSHNALLATADKDFERDPPHPMILSVDPRTRPL